MISQILIIYKFENKMFKIIYTKYSNKNFLSHEFIIFIYIILFRLNYFFLDFFNQIKGKLVNGLTNYYRHESNNFIV